jgi:pullulanase
LRDKKGVHNSYNSPDDINHIDWTNKMHYPMVFDYYQQLIALRKSHPAFRLGNADLVKKHLEFLDAPKQVVAYRLKNYAGRDRWRNIIVVLNASKKAETVSIPQGKYTVVCANGVINLRPKGLETFEHNQVTVDPQSALIIHD